MRAQKQFAWPTPTRPNALSPFLPRRPDVRGVLFGQPIVLLSQGPVASSLAQGHSRPQQSFQQQAESPRFFQFYKLASSIVPYCTLLAYSLSRQAILACLLLHGMSPAANSSWIPTCHPFIPRASRGHRPARDSRCTSPLPTTLSTPEAMRMLLSYRTLRPSSTLNLLPHCTAQ